jgi:exonuclease SbcC
MESLPAELDLGELKRIDEEYAERNRQLGEKNSVLSERKRKVAELQGEIERLRKIGEELSRAKKFYELLEKIRDDVFHRDGPVLKSLRTWVYGRVSDRAREYLDMFDVRIDDVRIIEEGGERGGVRFVCFYGGREVDSDRLSGGEKVALALAIRLAIGDVLGAQKLGFFILDEPTIHLDSENKKKLQEVFASLGELAGQTIVITHDEELFEDADATILRFERGPAPNSPTEIQTIRTARTGSTAELWSHE